MLLYLLRHGAAEPKAETDEKRELTPTGIIETRSMVQKFKLQVPVIDKAIMSPYKRARQTASVLQDAFPNMKIDVDERIQPESDIYDLMDSLEQGDVRHLLIVSHNPFLSNLLSVLVDATMETNRPIGTSVLVCVMVDFIAPGCGQILYTIEP